eukprot:3968935-Amphidinium_carterae.1
MHLVVVVIVHADRWALFQMVCLFVLSALHVYLRSKLLQAVFIDQLPFSTYGVEQNRVDLRLCSPNR